MKRSRDEVDGPVEGKIVQKQRILLSFDWDSAAVGAFAESANAIYVNHSCNMWWEAPEAPQWARTPPPYMTTKSVVDDMLTHLRPLVGRRMGSHMLTMATLEEYKSVTQELQAFADDPLVQAAMEAMSLPRPLASLHVKFDIPGFSAMEQVSVVSNHTGHQVFTLTTQ